MSRVPLDLPNLLTLSRLPLAGLVWVAPGTPVWVLGCMAAAGLTDVLDGWAARRTRHDTPAAAAEARATGAWLDPLCDKTFILSCLVAVWVARQPPLLLLPLIASREILQAPLIVAYHLLPGLRHHRRYEFRAALLGKLTTTVQFLAVAAILFAHPWMWPIAISAALTGALAAGVYVARAVRQLREEPADPTEGSAAPLEPSDRLSV